LAAGVLLIGCGGDSAETARAAPDDACLSMAEREVLAAPLQRLNLTDALWLLGTTRFPSIRRDGQTFSRTATSC
jgi:hypothetical protein